MVKIVEKNRTLISKSVVSGHSKIFFMSDHINASHDLFQHYKMERTFICCVMLSFFVLKIIEPFLFSPFDWLHSNDYKYLLIAAIYKHEFLMIISHSILQTYCDANFGYSDVFFI